MDLDDFLDNFEASLPKTEEELMERYARERGISIGEVLREKEIANLVSKETNRLSFTEALLMNGEISPEQARNILYTFPIIEDELRAIYEDSRQKLEMKYEIAIPDYRLRFDETLISLFYGQGITLSSKEGGMILLPKTGPSTMPLIISHEQGHAYQAVNGKIYQKLQRLKSTDKKGYHEASNASGRLIEGWACFVSSLYCELRDRNLKGINFHQDGFDQHMKFLASGQADEGEITCDKYIEGFLLFERIHSLKGIESVKYAANNFQSDQELFDFAR